MVLSQIIRSRLQPILDPIGRFFGKLGTTPDILTGLGLTLALLAGFLFAVKSYEPYLAGLAILGSGIMDTLDGAVARATQKASGSLNDSIFDRISDIAMYAGIVYAGYHVAPTIVLLTLGISMLPTYVRVKAESLGIKFSSLGVGERTHKKSPLESNVETSLFLCYPQILFLSANWLQKIEGKRRMSQAVRRSWMRRLKMRFHS